MLLMHSAAFSNVILFSNGFCMHTWPSRNHAPKWGIPNGNHMNDGIMKVNSLAAPMLPGSFLHEKEPWYETSIFITHTPHYKNKIVFKKMWYVSAWLSISSYLQCLHNSQATSNTLAYIVCVKQFVMSLTAISLGDWFSVSRKGGTGVGGLVYMLRTVTGL